MTENFSDEEFAPIAAAMKKLPYFAPSPQFADKVMARVRMPGAAQVPAVADRRAVAARVEPVYPTTYERRTPREAPHTDLRRSVPARIAVAGLVASLGLTLTVVSLVAFFDLNIFVLVTRIFGENAIAFLASMAADASASVAGTAAGSVATAGTAAGAAVVGSFAAGLVAATAVLRAAASASRKAA